MSLLVSQDGPIGTQKLEIDSRAIFSKQIGIARITSKKVFGLRTWTALRAKTAS